MSDSKREPKAVWFWAYGVVAVGFICSHSMRPYPLDYVLKAVPDLIVLAVCWFCFKGFVRVGMVSACLASAVGDVALGLNRVSNFKIALISYLIAHVLFAAVFFRDFRYSATGVSKALFAFIATAIIGVIVVPRAGALAIPVLIYIAGITVMAVGAAFLNGKAGLLVYAGACAFICCDSSIALDKFVQSISIPLQFIFTLYYSAIFFIVFGMCRYVTYPPKLNN